ncbi:sodium:solute symporter family protein [Salicibibacter halophilus]|uniref:Sodium:solute symporter family protein n=1 Tax=Salicibibacter halophilus TaxID=2502791 RepID=A0A514LF67_9BACI|nr:sodium:solute symporter family protein [Salicibibacter halophilus]QDI90489.1 sodium:solute symporter family protein [Salicibibacter halophilus]
MKIIEISIMLLYFIFIIILGRYAQTRIKTSQSSTTEYYVAGRRVGTGVNALALMAALGSGGSFMAGVGSVWELGLPFITWQTLGSIAGFALASVLVAKPMRNSRLFTVTDFLVDRYEHSFFKIAVPLVIIIGSGMYLMSQMTAGGLIGSYVTGLSYEWGVVIIALVFILYVALGGMLAVTWTNILQGAMMVLLISIVCIGAIINLPMPYPDFLLNATNENPALGTVGETMPVAGYIGAFTTWAVAVCVIPHLLMRIFTATDDRSAKLSMNIGMLTYGSLMVGTVLLVTPFIALLSNSLLEANPSDMWLLLIAEQFFGPIIMGVLAAGIMAAVMSSVDALLLAVSSAVAYDLYKGWHKPKATQRQVLKVSAISTWVIGLVVMVLSLNPPDFLVVLYTAAVGFMAASLFGPLVLGIWWKRANHSGAIVGLLVGSVSYLIAFFGFELPYNSEILIALPLSIVALVSVSALTEKPSQEAINRMAIYHEREV